MACLVLRRPRSLSVISEPHGIVGSTVPGFSKGSFHCSDLLLKGCARFVCLNLIFSLLCMCALHQGKASARASFHRPIILLKGSERLVDLNLIFSLVCLCDLLREGFSKGSFSLFKSSSQGLCKVCMPESDLFFALYV